VVRHFYQVLSQITVVLNLLIVYLFHTFLLGPSIIDDALEGHVLGSQATYYLYMLCNEDTYKQSVGTSNLLSTQLLSTLTKKISLCCAIGVPFNEVWKQCLSSGLDCAIGNWKHLLSEDYTDLGTLIMRFVTGGHLSSNNTKKQKALTNAFKDKGDNLIRDYVKGAMGFPEITLKNSSSNILLDPGLIQYNYSIIHQLVMTWLKSEVSYDHIHHKNIDKIIDEAINWKLGEDIVCANCNLMPGFMKPLSFVGNAMKRLPATRQRKSLTTCHCCNWFRNISK